MNSWQYLSDSSRIPRIIVTLSYLYRNRILERHDLYKKFAKFHESSRILTFINSWRFVGFVVWVEWGHKNALRICYELTTIFGIGIRGQNFEQFKTFATNSRSLKNWKNWLRINTNQLTHWLHSTTNPKISQFVAIRGIRGLCGIINRGINGPLMRVFWYTVENVASYYLARLPPRSPVKRYFTPTVTVVSE